MSLLPSLQTSERAPLLQVVKTSIATILAWLVAAAVLGQPLPIFAAIAALLVVAPSVSQSLSKGVERSVGVLGGVVLAYLVGLVFGRASWAVLAVVVVALLASWALRLGPGSANQIPISAMLVLAIGGPTPIYAIDRVVETIIGSAVALAVNLLIVPPVVLAPAHVAVGRLLQETAACLDAVAGTLRSPASAAELDAVLERCRALRGLRDSAAAAVAAGRESLTLNPRRTRHRVTLERDAELLGRLTALVTRVIGMARAVRDRYEPELPDDPIVQAIGTQLSRAAHDLRLLDREKTPQTPETLTSEMPALTSPLRVEQPDPRHWILVGSLLEDLRRVREEIVGGRDH